MLKRNYSTLNDFFEYFFRNSQNPNDFFSSHYTSSRTIHVRMVFFCQRHVNIVCVMWKCEEVYVIEWYNKSWNRSVWWMTPLFALHVIDGPVAAAAATIFRFLRLHTEQWAVSTEAKKFYCSLEYKHFMLRKCINEFILTTVFVILNLEHKQHWPLGYNDVFGAWPFTTFVYKCICSISMLTSTNEFYFDRAFGYNGSSLFGSSFHISFWRFTCKRQFIVISSYTFYLIHNHAIFILQKHSLLLLFQL